MNQKRYLSAKEAAGQLEINKATLYAYVSKGLVRSEEGAAGSRNRRYLAEDVQRLVDRKEQRRDPAKAAQDALYWGTPVLESRLTLITEQGLFYRGQDACELAQNNTLEEVAALLWTGSMDNAGALFGTPLALRTVSLPPGSPMRVMQVTMAMVAEENLAAFNLTPEAVATTGTRILWLLTYALIESSKPEQTIAATLARGWKADQENQVELLNAALILCADHELNASSFTARVIASAEANPYEVVLGGLAALQGFRHGGHTRRVSALLREINEPRDVVTVIGERLLRGEPIPGFGHRLYPQGDPRAALLLDLIRRAKINAKYSALTKAIVEEVQRVTGEAPTIDFALATLERILNLPPDSALALFALGRTVGWIGHAIEQYSTGQLIRPRAAYTGRQPSEKDRR
jgi:citrate synthase